mgnify:CR=1 FL=1
MASSGRAAVRMSPDEVEEFLGSHMKVQVATVNPDGSPHLTTLFYAMIEDRITFWTYGRSQKIRNLERDDRVMLVALEDEHVQAGHPGHARAESSHAGRRLRHGRRRGAA